MLLDALGRPALWSAPLHWAQLQAAVLVTDGDAAARHTEALAGAAGGSRFAAAMATARIAIARRCAWLAPLVRLA